MHVLGFEELAEIRGGAALAFGSETLEFGDDTKHVLLVIAVGLAGAATVLRLFAAAGHLLTGDEHHLPAVFALGPLEALGGLLVDENLATLDAAATENLENHFEELGVVNGPDEAMVTKVTRTPVIIETTGAAQLAVLQYAHARIR